MSELPPLVTDQRMVDANHLKLLSIFHFVGAGLSILGIFFVLAHFAISHAIFAHLKLWENQKQTPPPAEFFAFLTFFYLVFAVWTVGSGVLNAISALCLRARKHRTFSLVVAGLNCTHFPLGTVLGIFTIIVLVRDSVRQLYKA